MPATLQALVEAHERRVHEREHVERTSSEVKALLKKTVETGRKGRVNNQGSMTRTERFQWFLLPAVLLGLLSLSREFQRQAAATPGAAGAVGRQASRAARTELRRYQWHSRDCDDRAAESARRTPAPFAAAITALTVGLAHRRSSPAHAPTRTSTPMRGFEVKQVFESNPTDRVRRIAEHLAKYDYDAFDLELLVQESIKYGLDIQRTGGVLSDGVIRDAIEATRQGEKLDKSLADWGYYRSQLTTLLAPGKTEEKEESLAQNAVMDEEDNRPMVIGENSQSFANDSFGEGASAKSDAALGDLTPSERIEPQRNGAKPTPPKQVKMATSSRTKPGGGEAEDPIMQSHAPAARRGGTPRFAGAAPSASWRRPRNRRLNRTKSTGKGTQRWRF